MKEGRISQIYVGSHHAHQAISYFEHSPRHIDGAEHSTCDKIESRLQSGGVLVLYLSCRLGNGNQVRTALNLLSKAHDVSTVIGEHGKEIYHIATE